MVCNHLRDNDCGGFGSTSLDIKNYMFKYVRKRNLSLDPPLPILPHNQILRLEEVLDWIHWKNSSRLLRLPNAAALGSDMW